MDKQAVYRYLVTAASLVIVVAGLRAARPLAVPFLLACFFAVILAPVLHWLQTKGIRTAVALLFILGTFTLLGSGLLLLVGKSFNDFTDKLPAYEKSLTEQTKPLIKQLRSYGIELPDVPKADLGVSDGLLGSDSAADTDAESSDFPDSDPAADEPTDPTQPGEKPSLDTAWLVSLAKSMLSGVSAIFSNALVIFITVTFMLLEAARLPAKLEAAFSKSDATMEHIDVIVGNVRRYVAIKSATSALTGVLVTISLLLLGVDYAILWGLLAFLFNFVPNVGSIMAAVPAVGLAFLQAGTPTALGAVAVYVAVNCFISYVIEPRYMGQGLGLSTLVVFLSLVFWGWVLGPIGMLLSAPLTMILKIILDDYESTRWISILLSSKPPDLDGPSESGRQRYAT
jgi:predicted PurR-regulated permease PerM